MTETGVATDVRLRRWARRGTWLLPVYGLLTFAGTLTHQPDPAADFGAWSRYVTTTWFYASHLVASLLGLSLGVLGVAALAVLVSSTRRGGAALLAFVLTVVGTSVVFGLFGVAAFVQPAMGQLHLSGDAGVTAWYDLVFLRPATLVPTVLALLLFSSGSVVMGWALAAVPAIPRWAALAYAFTGPLIGLFGVVIGSAQTVGSVLMVVAGAVIAARAAPSPAPLEESRV